MEKRGHCDHGCVPLPDSEPWTASSTLVPQPPFCLGTHPIPSCPESLDCPPPHLPPHALASSPHLCPPLPLLTTSCLTVPSSSCLSVRPGLCRSPAPSHCQPPCSSPSTSCTLLSLCSPSLSLNGGPALLSPYKLGMGAAEVLSWSLEVRCSEATAGWVGADIKGVTRK